MPETLLPDNPLGTAWLAGLFEGEGSMYHVNERGVVLTIKMADRDIIERCRTVAGVGRIYDKGKRSLKHKRLWQWQVAVESHAAEVLRCLMPHLGERRRERAERALKRLDQPDQLSLPSYTVIPWTAPNS